MFQNIKEIEYLDLSSFDNSSVINMQGMFYGCSKLKEIRGINKFITNKVLDMSGMFQMCKEIEILDLSNFDISNDTNIEGMFEYCDKLKEIKGINKFVTNKLINNNDSFKK